MYSYQLASKIKNIKEGGYFINNEKYVDVLLFMYNGNIGRAYKERENNYDLYSFDEKLRKTILHNPENQGKYEIDDSKNEIKIIYSHSTDNRIMRCKLRGSGILVVNYFYQNPTSQKNEKQVLEYQFNEDLKFWLNNLPSPNLGYQRFTF